MSGGRIERIVEPLDDGRFLCVFLLLGADGAVLVDTGLAATPERTIAPALARLGLGWDDLRAVVVTHADVDHCGGLGAVRRLAPRAAVLAGAADRALIESSELLLARRYREFRDEHAIDQPETFSAWVRANADDGAVDLALAGDGTLRIDREWTVALLAAPGHTAGHLVVHDAGSATVIAADAVLGGFSPAPTASRRSRRPTASCRATARRSRGCSSSPRSGCSAPTCRRWRAPRSPPTCARAPTSSSAARRRCWRRWRTARRARWPS